MVVQNFSESNEMLLLMPMGETVYKDLMLGTPNALEGPQGLLLLRQGALHDKQGLLKPTLYVERVLKAKWEVLTNIESQLPHHPHMLITGAVTPWNHA